MKQEKLLDKLCVYGDFYSVLSSKCYGCHNYAYICGGPERGICYGGEFEFDKYSAYAEYVICEKMEQNLYLFARAIGESKENLLKTLEKFKSKIAEKEIVEEPFLSTSMMAIEDIQKVLSYSDKEIEDMTKKYHLDLEIHELDPILDEMFSKELMNSSEELEDTDTTDCDMTYLENTKDDEISF